MDFRDQKRHSIWCFCLNLYGDAPRFGKCNVRGIIKGLLLSGQPPCKGDSCGQYTCGPYEWSSSKHDRHRGWKSKWDLRTLYPCKSWQTNKHVHQWRQKNLCAQPPTQESGVSHLAEVVQCRRGGGRTWRAIFPHGIHWKTRKNDCDVRIHSRGSRYSMQKIMLPFVSK